MMATEGDVAIVTGAAQGIGKCITKCLLSEGYQVGTNTNCMYHSVKRLCYNYKMLLLFTLTTII